jgi:hypothetical protein
MELKSLTAKPQLVEIKINDEETVAKYGEAVTFFVLDRLPMDTFVRVSMLDFKDIKNLLSLAVELILDKDGKPVMTEEELLPTDLVMKAVEAFLEQLGKLMNVTAPAKSSTP